MSKSCPKCGSRMDKGFVLDNDYGTKRVAEWIEGEPQRAWFGSVKLRGKGRNRIESWRCPRCTFVETYAP